LQLSKDYSVSKVSGITSAVKKVCDTLVNSEAKRHLLQYYRPVLVPSCIAFCVNNHLATAILCNYFFYKADFFNQTCKHKASPFS